MLVVDNDLAVLGGGGDGRADPFGGEDPRVVAGPGAGPTDRAR